MQLAEGGNIQEAFFILAFHFFFCTVSYNFKNRKMKKIDKTKCSYLKYSFCFSQKNPMQIQSCDFAIVQINHD